MIDLFLFLAFAGIFFAPAVLASVTFREDKPRERHL